MLRPTEPRGNSLFVRLDIPKRLLTVQSRALTAEVLLRLFPYEFLSPIKLVPDIIERTPVTVKPVVCDRENLPILLDREPKPQKVFTQEREHLAEAFLAVAEQGYVIGVLRSVNSVNLIHAVHNIAQDKVREILRQVVSDRQACQVVRVPDIHRDTATADIKERPHREGFLLGRRDSGIDYVVQQPQQVGVFYFPPNNAFQHRVTDGRIELPKVDFKAIQGLPFIFTDNLINITRTALYAPSFHAGKGIVRESPNPYRFKDVHYGVVDYSVGIVRKPVYYAFFRFINREHIIRGGSVCLGSQSLVQSLYVRFSVLIVTAHTVCRCFPTASLFIGKPQILDGNYLFV